VARLRATSGVDTICKAAIFMPASIEDKHGANTPAPLAPLLTQADVRPSPLRQNPFDLLNHLAAFAHPLP
jgi:hypothetical protein